MGWKLFAIFRLLATALLIYDVAVWREVDFGVIIDCVLATVATGIVCLYAFDGKLLPKPLRIVIAIGLSIALAQTAFFYAQILYWLPRYELILTDFAIPIISGALCVWAAWRYSAGHSVGAVKA